jgi:hypothetical protein
LKWSMGGHPDACCCMWLPQRAACLFVSATVVVDRDCSLLVALHAPLLATLGTILSIMDGNVGRCSPAIAWGRAKLGCLVAVGVLGGDAAPLDGAVLGDVS